MVAKYNNLIQSNIFLALLTLILFGLVKLVISFASLALSYRLVFFTLTIIVVVSTCHLLPNTRTLPKSSKIVFLGIVAIFSLYLVLAKPNILSENTSYLEFLELNLYRWIAPLLGVLAYWRTTFSLPLFIAVLFQKTAIENFFGFPISPTDYLTIIEFGLVFTIGVVLHHYGQSKLNFWKDRLGKNRDINYIDFILLTAIAMHFSNYFYSGLQKVFISEPYWQWALTNPTYTLTLAALENGSSPISALSNVSINNILENQIKYNIVLNVSILALQLISLVAITRIRYAMLTTLLYDITHIIIFFASGIFFYKWIILNLLITYSLGRLRKIKLTIKQIGWLISVVVISPFIFFISFLGWFDTPSFNDEYFEAVTENGSLIRVPSNYFYSASVTAAQQRMNPKSTIFFPTNTYGSVDPRLIPNSDHKHLLNCQQGTKDDLLHIELEPNPNLIKFIQNNHAFVLNNINEDGLINYDFYPHHIFSMPWNFEEFLNLDKRTIKGYKYVVEAKCLSAQKVKLSDNKSLVRGEFLVPLR